MPGPCREHERGSCLGLALGQTQTDGGSVGVVNQAVLKSGPTEEQVTVGVGHGVAPGGACRSNDRQTDQAIRPWAR